MPRELTEAELDVMRKAFDEAAAKMEAELHAPRPGWPDGFYGKEDHAIMLDAGLRAAIAAGGTPPKDPSGW